MDLSRQPWISVSTLGEFVFCPRAGLLAANKGNEDEELESSAARLDFLPQYSLTAIEEQLALHLQNLGTWGGLFVGLLIMVGVSWYFAWKVAMLAAAVLLFWSGLRVGRHGRAVLMLADSRQQAMIAQPKEPPENLAGQVEINWWELLRAGFDSIRLQEILPDEQSKLAGKPWRVLRKGSLRIPVIRIGEDFYEGGRYWVYRQHEIRLAAYAHLIEACEGATSPYGIVLFGDSYAGVAVPITAKLRRSFEETLGEFRAALSAAESGVNPPLPDSDLCAGCPFGKPESVATKDLGDTRGKKVHGRTGLDGVLYHSECGDCFEWVPPHALAKKKKLTGPDT